MDHPLDITTSDNATANILYTVRFRVSKTSLRLIHERFGPERLQSIIRDESRHIIRLSLNEKDYTSSDLLGPSRAHVEADINDRLRGTLSENGFELTHFGLREPDLGELGQKLREQMRTREEHKLEQEISKVEAERNRRAEQKAQSEAKIEAEKVTSKAKAEAQATRIRAETEAEIEAERVKSKAEAEAEARRVQAETEARLEAERITVHAEAVAEAERIQAETKRIQVDVEAYSITKRAGAEAEANKLLAKSISEEVLKYHQTQANLEAHLAAAQGWDGRLPMFSGKDTLSFLNLTSLVESLISKPAQEYQDEKAG